MTWKEWIGTQITYWAEYGIHVPVDYCHMGERYYYKLKGSAMMYDAEDLRLG